MEDAGEELNHVASEREEVREKLVLEDVTYYAAKGAVFGSKVGHQGGDHSLLDV